MINFRSEQKIYSLPNPYIYIFLSLLQRYQNVKAELEAQQNLERIKMEKLVRNICICN